MTITLIQVYHSKDGFVGYLKKDAGLFWIVENPWSSKKSDAYPSDECYTEEEVIEVRAKSDNRPEPTGNN